MLAHGRYELWRGRARGGRVSFNVFAVVCAYLSFVTVVLSHAGQVRSSENGEYGREPARRQDVRFVVAVTQSLGLQGSFMSTHVMRAGLIYAEIESTDDRSFTAE